jgi:nucleoid DNA-binding protein
VRQKISFFCLIFRPFDDCEPILSCMAKLTKRDIVVAISNQTGMVQHQVFDVVQRTLDHITDSLASNVAVELRNFGIFQPRLTKPRVGRNPNQPGSSFVIPPRATVKFKAGKIMRQRVEKLSRELKEAADKKATDQNGK